MFIQSSLQMTGSLWRGKWSWKLPESRHIYNMYSWSQNCSPPVNFCIITWTFWIIWLNNLSVWLSLKYQCIDFLQLPSSWFPAWGQRASFTRPSNTSSWLNCLSCMVFFWPIKACAEIALCSKSVIWTTDTWKHTARRHHTNPITHRDVG